MRNDWRPRYKPLHELRQPAALTSLPGHRVHERCVAPPAALYNEQLEQSVPDAAALARPAATARVGPGS
jgi:hypothetical protein